MKNFIAKWRTLLPWKRRLLAVLPIVTLISGLAWWYVDYRFPSWNEEVLLSDGRMLNVHRRQEYIEGYGVRRTWLTFSLPELGGKQTWSEWMYPAIVDVSGGKVYVVGLPIGRGQYLSYRQPRYLYVAYVFSGNEWKRVPFISLPEEIRVRENVLWCAERHTKLTWNLKSKGWCKDTSFAESGNPKIELLKLLETTQHLNRASGKTGFSE